MLCTFSARPLLGAFQTSEKQGESFLMELSPDVSEHDVHMSRHAHDETALK